MPIGAFCQRPLPKSALIAFEEKPAMISVLKGSTGFKICPICRNENLEVVPVEDHESYKMNIDSKRGIGIDFTKEKS